MKKIATLILITACFAVCFFGCVDADREPGGSQSLDSEPLQSAEGTPADSDAGVLPGSDINGSDVVSSTEPGSDFDPSTETVPEDSGDEPLELSLEYVRSNIKELYFGKIKFLMGMYTNRYHFDFVNNTVKSGKTVVAEFSDEEEEILINKLYSAGLFHIDDHYKSPENIVDGGGWELTIEFADGKTKKSTGSNNAPTDVFKKCAMAFYDICGDGVVSNPPIEYYRPPTLDYTFIYGNTYMGYSEYGARLDYKWNGFESTGNKIYDKNRATNFQQKFYADINYKLGFHTANYSSYHDYEKFSKIIIRSCDYNEDLTNEKTVYVGGWFDQMRIDLELGKIYIIRLEFEDGDFVEYTFNTKISPNPQNN